MSRSTGSVAGAARAVGLVTVCALWWPRIELAQRMGGEAAARRAFAGAAKRMLAKLGVNVRVEGKLGSEPEVRVANHTSYLDILALASADAGRFLSRHDLATWPMVGRIARQTGTLFVNRDSHGARAGALRALAKAARDGAPVLVFPEGRTSVGKLLPFQAGAFAVARSARVPVRPMALVYSAADDAAWVDDMALLPHVWRRLCGPEIELRIVTLGVLSIEMRSANELAAQAEHILADVLKSYDRVPDGEGPLRTLA